MLYLRKKKWGRVSTGCSSANCSRRGLIYQILEERIGGHASFSFLATGQIVDTSLANKLPDSTFIG